MFQPLIHKDQVPILHFILHLIASRVCLTLFLYIYSALLAQYRKEAERKRRMEGGQSGKRESGDRKSSSKSSSKHSSRAAAAEAK
mmetsp:Transcript_14201/g.16907  ORF Transcript_14201/g.16907 Transcript_14201/m.16907 type:complete len:85 (+) Transcript_14201:1201-1455(+)